MSSYNIPSTQNNINNFQEPQLSPQQQYHHHEQQNQQYSPELPQLTRKNSNLSLHSSRSIVTANSTMSTSTAPRNVATESLFAYDDRFQRKSRSSTRLQTLKTVRSDSMTSLSAYNNNIKRNSDMRLLPKSSSFSNSSNYRPNIPNSISASNISSLSDHQAANAFQSHSNASSRRPSMTSTSQLYHSNSSTSLNPTYRSQNTSSLVTPPPKLNTNNLYPRSQKPNVSKVPNVNKSPKSPNAPNGMYLFPNGEIFRPRQTPKNRSSRPQKINRQIYQQQQQQQQQQYDYIPNSNQIRNNAPVDNKLSSYSSMPNLKSFNRAPNMENHNGVNNYPNQVYRANNFPPINSFNSNNSTVISHNINTGINNNGSSNTFDEEVTNMTPLNEFRIENDMDTNNSGSLSSRTAISTTQSSISQGDHIYSDSLPSHSNNSSNSSNVTNDKLSSPPLNSISNLQSNNNKTTNSNNSIITPSNSSTSSSLVLNNQNALQSPLTLLSSYETLNSSADDELDNTHCNLKANLSMIKESATINDSLPTPTTTTDSIKLEENPEDLNDKIETIDIIEDKTEPQPINNFTKEFENLNDDSSIIVRKAPVLPTAPQRQEPQLESKRPEVYKTPIRNSIASTNSTVNRLRKNEEVARKPSMMKKMFGKLFSRSSSNSSTSTAPSTKEKKSLYQLPKEKSSSTWSLASKFKKQPSKQTNKNVSTTVTNTNSNINAVKRSSNLYNQVYNANLQPPVATTLNDQPVIKEEEEEEKEEPSNPLDQSTAPITKTNTYNYDFDDLNSFEIGDDTFLQEGNDLLTEAANFVEVDDNSEKKDPTYHQYTPSDSEEKLDSGLETVVEDQNPSSENASNDISLTSIPIDTNSDNVDISFDEDMDLDYISTIIGLGETSLFFDHKHQNEPSALQRRKSIRIKSLEKRKSLIRHNTIGSNRSNNSTIFGEDGTSSTIKSFDSFSNTPNDEMDDDMDFYDDFKSLQKTHMNGVDTSKMNKVESFEVITTNQLKLPLSKLDLSLMPRKKSCLKPIRKNFSSQSKFSIGGNSSHNSNASSATVSPDSSSSSLYKNNNNTSSYVQLNPNKTNSSTSLDSGLSFTPLSHNHAQQTQSLSPSQQQQNQFMDVSELTSIPPIKKSVSFSNKVRLNDTFSPHDYDRFNLPLKQRYQYLSNNPSKIKDIRIELNTFKQRDMPIHELSKAYTHFLHT